MKKIYTFILFALSALILNAQTIQKLTISSVPGTVCPEVQTQYEVNASGYWNTCAISWSATNGTVIADANNRKKASVVWKDTPGAKGKVTVTFTNCDGEGGSVSREELILSIKEQSWGFYGNSINIDYCSKSPVFITMPRMLVQGTGGVAQPPLTEASYVWTLPTGWRQLGTNKTGTFGTPTNYITIEPIDCAKLGSVTVYGTLVGAGPFCNSAAPSATATISLNGVNPAVTVNPHSGFNGVTACNTTPVTFTATMNASLGCVNNYSWTFPTSWTEVSRNTNTITLQPTGKPADAGNIRATVNFTCGSSIQSANYVLPYIPPVMTGPNVVCDSEPYTIQNTSGLTVTWSSSNTNIATINSTGMVTKVGNASGEVTITATLPCSVPPATKSIWVGTPTLSNLICTNCEGIFGLPSEGCQGKIDVFQSELHPQYPSNQWSSFGWSGTNVDIVTNSANTAWVKYIGSVGSYASVTATVTGQCGQWPGTYTWLGEIIYCGCCDETYIVYPNPSNDEIAITSGQLEIRSSDKKYRVTIVNGQNSIMYQGDVFEGKEIKVQVRDWKAGTYYVKLVNGENVKQVRLIVEH